MGNVFKKLFVTVQNRHPAPIKSDNDNITGKLLMINNNNPAR